MGLLACLMILGVLGCRRAEQADQTINTKIEVSLHFEKPTVMLGEPAWFTFRIRNHSTEDLQVFVGGDNRNDLLRPNSFKINAVGTNGATVPQPTVRLKKESIGSPQVLPANGSYDFKLFMPHWATFESPGRYTITCARQLAVMKTETFSSAFQKRLLVDTRTTGALEVLPTDDRATETIVETLGKKLREGNREEKTWAVREMDSIKDESIIPHLKLALESGDYLIMATALAALGKFESGDAFKVLQHGMSLTGADLKPGTTKEVETVLAGSLRGEAARSLGRSSRPEAIPFLLKQHDDPSDGVRLAIVSVLGKLKTPESLAMLSEMTRDKTEVVRKEAKRQFEIRTNPKAP